MVPVPSQFLDAVQYPSDVSSRPCEPEGLTLPKLSVLSVEETSSERQQARRVSARPSPSWGPASHIRIQTALGRSSEAVTGR